MNVSFDLNFWAVIVSVSSLLLSAYTAARSRAKAELNDVRHHEERISRISERLGVCEAAINGFDGDDILAAHKRLDSLQQSISKIEGLVEGMNSNMKMLMESQMRRRAGDA